ncbi:MAG: M23 family metallopeptidase [Eubacteriales bacterium]
MKGKLAAVIALVILFIPTYIAVAYYVSAQNAPVTESAVNKMELIDLYGDTYDFEKSSASTSENVENNILAFFMEMNNAATAEAALPDQLSGADFFKVTYYKYETESVYRYYFSSNPGDTYYIDGDGGVFRIPADIAGKFLLTKYARSVYDSSSAPTLTLLDQTIEPQTLVWKYVNYTGNYSISDQIDNTASAIQTYELVGGSFNLGFTVQPDLVSVRIVENGEIVFDDVYENIGNVNLNADATINVSITAKWYESTERGYAGEASYAFYADVAAQPVFYLGETDIEPGEFVVLTGINVKDIAGIQFASEPAIDFTPTFFKDDKYVRALIPISIYLDSIAELEASSEASMPFTFSLTTSGVTQTLTLNVTQKTFKNQDYEIPSDIVQVKRNESTITAFNDAMASVYSSADSQKYWSGAFAESCGGIIRTGYGIHRRIVSTKEEYRHEGVDYIVNSGDTAVAANAGRVIYVGEQVLSGKIVVVDHGWGLKTTYAHLSAANVAEGDTVEKGSVIGTVGSTGFTDGLMFHISYSVYGVTVCPYSLWDEGILMTEISEITQ